MDTVIKIENLRKEYPGFTLDIPKLCVKGGYITGFIGENGAGKTTTLRLIMDAIRADTGEIAVLGGNLRQNPEKIVTQIGFVENLNCFHPSFRIRQIDKLLAPFFPDWETSLFERYCKRFSLDLNAKVKSLSSGRLKLLSLTAALAHKPKLLILDEPTTNLDPIVRNEILELFGELMQDEETSIFYSTHITSDLDKTADYIIFIRDGRIALHEEKDILLGEYCIIKGDNNLLEGKSCRLMGVKKTQHGFSALARRDEAQRVFGDRVLLERPNIEDFMIYANKEEWLYA